MTKQFPRSVVLSVVSGTLLHKQFSDVHECIEHMAGGPVWTHSLPSWRRENLPALLELWPEMAPPPAGLFEKPTDALAWMALKAEWLAEMIDVPTLGKGGRNPFADICPTTHPHS